MANEIPLISVIMGIYNCEDTLTESLDSLFNQTFKNFEVILCDDGSNDNTYTIAQKYLEIHPDRIVLLRNEKNMGLNFTLNKCLKHTKGKYIARMDGDDISLPSRFEKQFNFLEKFNNISIVSCKMIHFDRFGDWGIGAPITAPTKQDLIKGSPFSHAACMVTRDAMMKVNGYSESRWLLRVEDYHLWVKMYSIGYIGYNLDEVLYMMRDDQNASQRRRFKYRINETYVRFLAFKNLNLPKKNWPFIFYPLLIGILPKSIYNKLHRYKLKNNSNK
jgi:glycosyltransferase EpsE